MEKYGIGYCRVSTNKQAQEGESLDVQEKIERSLAERKGIVLLNVFREAYSGENNNRPIIGEIFDFIKSSDKKIEYLIVRNIDRFTRGGVVAYELLKGEFGKVGVEIIDSTGIIQPKSNTLEHLGMEFNWSKFSPSAIAEMVVADTAQAEKRNILTRTIGSQIQLARDGYHVGYITDGYIIRRTFVANKKKSILVPDPERAHYWTELYAMRANGSYTDQEIVDKINSMGFRTKVRNKWDKAHENIIGTVGGNPLTIKELQQQIGRTIYCGVTTHKWNKRTPIKAKFQGLVSVETFNAANRGKVYIEEQSDGSLDIKYDYHPERVILKRLKNNPLFPFKFLLCPHCKKPFLGSSPSGKSKKGFPTYHCNRGHSYFGVKKSKLENDVANMISQFQLSPAFLKTFELVLINKYRSRQKELAEFSSSVSINISELKIQQSQAIDVLVKTTSEIARKAIEERIEGIEAQIKSAQSQRSEVEITEDDISEFIKFAKYFMEHLKDLLMDSQNQTKQQAFWSLLFDKIPDYDQIVNGTPELSLIFELSDHNSDPKNLIARAVGIEPTLEVLETPVLPLYYARLLDS